MDRDRSWKRAGHGKPPSYGDVVRYIDDDDGDGVQETDVDNVPDTVGDGVPMEPPPDYDAAVAMPSHYAPTQEPEGDEQPEGAVGGDPGLSPEEVTVALRMQDDRSSYMPGDRKSLPEAHEMIGYNSEEDEDGGRHSDQEPQVDTVLSLDLHSVEAADSRRARAAEDYRCTGFGPLDGPLTRVCVFLRTQSRTRLALLIGGIVFAVGFILFLGLFPASFVYVEYHEIALKQSKMTNVVDRDTVYYPGCYILGPDTKFVRFHGTAHEITKEMSVFTLDTISVDIKYSVQYFLRPEEVGSLYTMFMHDYAPFFEKMVKATIRNTAAMTLTVDQFRFNRTQVERQLHAVLSEKLGGNCCPACCKRQVCQYNIDCFTCSHDNCNRGYYVDVRYFFLMSVGIPSEVFERYLRRNVLEIEAEHEYFKQGYALETKKSQLYVQKHKNNATEIISNATAQADRLATVTTAESEKIVQSSYASALKGLFSLLNVTQEDHKLSLMMIRALEDVSSNLYMGSGYEKNTIIKP